MEQIYMPLDPQVQPNVLRMQTIALALCTAALLSACSGELDPGVNSSGPEQGAPVPTSMPLPSSVPSPSSAPVPSQTPSPVATPTPGPSSVPAPSASPSASPSPSIGAPTPINPTADTKFAFEMAKSLKRGINMGDVFDAAPAEGSWGEVITDQMLDRIKEAGFRTVRIPVRWSNHAELTAPYTISPAFFDSVERVMTAARNRDLLIVINMHHYTQMTDVNGWAQDYGEVQVGIDLPLEQRIARVEERFVAMWEQIAKRFKGWGEGRLMYELYNEPSRRLDATWNSLYPKALEKVRAHDPLRVVILGPANWNAADALASFKPPTQDGRIIITIHNYQPYEFTYIGADSSITNGNATCCTADQIKRMTEPLDIAVKWAGSRWPLWLGEFGSYAGPTGDGTSPSGATLPQYASRVTFARAMRDEAEKRGITWAVWNFGGKFGIYDTTKNVWRTELRDALMKP
jgi:endoglucanase